MLFNSKFKLLCYIKYLMAQLGLESDLAIKCRLDSSDIFNFWQFKEIDPGLIILSDSVIQDLQPHIPIRLLEV
jgi:hypothetical protein